MLYTRREFGKLALGATAGALWLRSNSAFAATVTRPNSKWAGVEVGMNVPYSFGTRAAMSAEDVLAQCVELGLSDVELRAQPIEKSLGLPDTIVVGPAWSDILGALAAIGDIPGVERPGAVLRIPAGRPGAGSPMTRTPEQLAEYKAAAERLRQWRLTVAMDTVRALKAKYDAAGVRIGVVKFDGISDLPDDELDYAFTLAKTLGASAISGELSMPAAEKLGKAADRNKLFVAYHSHLAGSPAVYEQALSHGKFAAANLDIGHFVAGNYGSPVPFLKKHHDRITHIHVKDRKANGGPNVPFGEGDTPIKEVLQLIRDNRWPIQAIIEFEIPLPQGADRTPHLVKCLEYWKECLLS
jgi:sugar phosphate isomerase/epimerase